MKLKKLAAGILAAVMAVTSVVVTPVVASAASTFEIVTEAIAAKDNAAWGEFKGIWTGDNFFDELYNYEYLTLKFSFDEAAIEAAGNDTWKFGQGVKVYSQETTSGNWSCSSGIMVGTSETVVADKEYTAIVSTEAIIEDAMTLEPITDKAYITESTNFFITAGQVAATLTYAALTDPYATDDEEAQIFEVVAEEIEPKDNAAWGEYKGIWTGDNFFDELYNYENLTLKFKFNAAAIEAAGADAWKFGQGVKVYSQETTSGNWSCSSGIMVGTSTTVEADKVYTAKIPTQSIIDDAMTLEPITDKAYITESTNFFITAGQVAATLTYAALTDPIAPETEEPTTEAPATEEPVTEEPVTEEPVTEEPVTEEPVAPTVENLTATAGENSVTVQWDAVEGATNYKVFTYLNGKYAVAGETTDPYYYVGDLEAGTEYGFLVRAFVNNVWTTFTNDDVVYATPTAPIVTKPAVSVAPTANAGEVALTWGAVTNATNYKVFTYLNGKYAVVDETTETSYTVTGLTGGEECGFLVRAYVDGAWTAFDTAEDVVYATPVAAASTKPVIEVTAGVGSALVEWDAVAGATNYRVYTYHNGYVLAGETTETSYNVTGLTGGVEYGFLVRALVDGKWSAFTTEDNVNATPSALKPVFEVTAGVNSAEVEWEAIEGATSYKVFTYRLNKYTLVTTTEETSYTITGLVGGTEYGVLVRACVNGVWTAFTTADNLTVTPLAAAKPVVSITDDGNDTLTVTWEAIDGATSYKVFTYIDGKYAVAGETTELTYDVVVDVIEGGILVRACVNGVWSSFTNSDVAEFHIYS